MKLVTIATHGDGYFDFLKESCKRSGAHIDILGWGQKWTGFNMKYKLLEEYIKNLDDTEIVCLIDAYDTLLLDSLENIEQKFLNISKTKNIDIIISEHSSKNILYKIGHILYFGRHKKCIVNAGTYIGYVHRLKHLLKFTAKNLKQSDDQIILTKYCNKYPQKIYIDTQKFIFFTFQTNINEDVLPYFKKHNVNSAGILHLPGRGNMSNILKYLGYQIDNKKIKELYRENLNYLNKNINYYSWNFLKTNILIITLYFLCISVIIFYIFNIQPRKK